MIPDHSHGRSRPCHLLEQFDALSHQILSLIAQPCDVPVRAAETLDESPAYEVPASDHDDRHSRRCRFECGQRCGYGDNHIDARSEHFVYQARESIGLALGPARFGHELSSEYVAALAQSLQERLDSLALRVRPSHTGGHLTETKDSEPIDLARLLRLGGQRRGEEATGQRSDEGSPCHH